MRILVTGSCGFVGWHLVEYLLQKTDWEIIGIDSFRHAGDCLRAHLDGRYEVIYHDFNAPVGSRLFYKLGHIDSVINLASISDVNESILSPVDIWENNTRLIGNVLEMARKKSVSYFIQCSTDEVFGPAEAGEAHAEWSVIVPSNPYSASKAAQEALCIAYWRTYGVPVVITNTMNMIGERQEPTKFLPMIIQAVDAGDFVTIHGNPGREGSRIYLDAKNLADAWLFLLKNHSPAKYHDSVDPQRPSRFNVVGQEEITNVDLAKRVADIMGKKLYYEYEDFHLTRPGHDRRYAMDGSKLAALGWRHPIPFDETLRRVIAWTLQNREWL